MRQQVKVLDDGDVRNTTNEFGLTIWQATDSCCPFIPNVPRQLPNDVSVNMFIYNLAVNHS